MSFFAISSVLHDHRQIHLTDESTDFLENKFTIITGRNACGKSRLLRKIVSNYIFSDRYDLLEASDVLPSFYSETRPSCVIAVSTGSRDKFPRPTEKTQESGIGYHLIGSYQRYKTVRSQVSILSSSFLQVIRNIAKEDRNSDKLARAFNVLGYAPSFTMQIDESYEVKKARTNHKKNLEIDSQYLGAIKAIESMKTLYSSVPFWLHLNLLHHLDRRDAEMLERIGELVEAGHLRIVNIELFSVEEKNRQRLNDASSGQQCMIEILIGIAASIKDNSLICIDEPEISLHPEWQANIINMLQELFDSYKGCHFLIATHSPQVVAGLKSRSGLVLDLEKHETYTPNFFAERSADFQLAEIFDAPGMRNEYLLRETLMLLTKLAKEAELTDADRSAIKKLKQMLGHFSEKDPVKHLIEQISVLYKK